MPEQAGQALGGVLAPRIQPREADGRPRARPAGLGEPLTGPGEVVVGRLGRRGDEPVEAGDARLLEQLGQRAAAAVEARSGVHERVHDHRSTLSISTALVVVQHLAQVGGRETRAPHLVELDGRRAAGTVGAEDHALGPDAAHRLRDQLGIRAARRLEHDVLAALGDRQRILAVEVRAHVAEHDGRLGDAQRGLLELERRAERVVAAVDQRRRPEPRGRADQPQRALVGGMRDGRDRMQLEPDEAQLADRAHDERLGLVAVPRVDARVGLEAPRPARARIRDHLERGRIDLRRVGDRHDHGGLNARLVELLDSELGRHVPAERRHVVDMEVGIDDGLVHAPTLSGGSLD